MAVKHLSTESAQRTKVLVKSLWSATMILQKLMIRHLVRNLQILSEWLPMLHEEAVSFQPKTTLVSVKLAAKSAINS